MASFQVATFLIWKYCWDCLWVATYVYESFENVYLKEISRGEERRFLKSQVWNSRLKIRILEYGLIGTQFSIQLVSLIKQMKSFSFRRFLFEFSSSCLPTSFKNPVILIIGLLNFRIFLSFSSRKMLLWKSTHSSPSTHSASCVPSFLSKQWIGPGR